jgi:hypothetical protein
LQKKVAVIQSNYIPWKGYFDILNDADIFIFYDDVQFTKNDWRNRNKIKREGGTHWLSVPVGTDINRLINEVKITDGSWGKKHFKTLEQYYIKAPHFKEYKGFLEYIYMEKKWEGLSELNHYIIKTIALDFLKCETVFELSETYSPEGKRLERLLDLLKKCGATSYITGPSAESYIDKNEFIANGIELIFKDYSGYPEYPQLYPPFEHYVSVLDLLFNTGSNAPYYIWGWRKEKNENEIPV